MSAPLAPEDPLLTPSEVGVLFRVSPKTVTRWANAGRIGFVRTLGGHRRYRQTEVDRLLSEGTFSASVRVLPGARGGVA